MLQHERDQMAGIATARIAGLFQGDSNSFYLDSLRHKLVVFLQAIDRAVRATDRSVLFADAIEGFDLVVLRNPDLPLGEDDSPALDSRAQSSVDESCLTLLSEALNKYLVERLAAGEDVGEGAFVYKGGDGLHYFVFKSQYRQSILRELGVSEDGLISHDSGSGVLQ